MSNALGVHPVIAQVLINRQLDDPVEAQSFLEGSLSDLHDPFLLRDMDLAVSRIKLAKEKSERVLIYGDYDVDGVTSSVILKRILTEMGLTVSNYIPNRMKEGYGLNFEIVHRAKKNNINLLIAVDCGINAIEQIKALNDQGIDVIVIDHHEPSRQSLPQAQAIINPKRADCPYPFKNLASVGLCAKLSQALLGKIPEDILDLVALGTIADVAELKGENRILTKEGLLRIPNTKHKGLLALLHSSGIYGKKIKPYSVGFILGPRINATGRIGSAEKALELLLSDDFEKAMALAQSLEEDNRLRQKTQKEVAQEAISLVERDVNFKEHRVIVLSSEGWHRGVVGIVASRIADTFYRPTIVISEQDGIGVGSARSIDSFHLYDALSACSDLLENFGGHEHAAGITIRKENIEDFRRAINDYAAKKLSAQDLIPSLEIDSEISFQHLDFNLAQIIESMEPWGEGNPSPVFCCRNLSLKSPPAVLGKGTLKIWVTDETKTFCAIGFGMASMADMIQNSKRIDCVFKIAIDNWRSEPTVLLKLKDIKLIS